MEVFVDTNVVIYAADPADPVKQRRSAEWMQHLWGSGTGRLSIQVLKEYYNTVTRKLKPGLTPQEAWDEVRDLWSWNPIATDLPLFERAWQIEVRFGFSFWDAMIVAAAHAAECGILLTEDLQDGQELDGIRVRSPFTLSPGEGSE